MVYILLLIIPTLITRAILIVNAPFLYFFDSYGYLSKAVDFANTGAVQFGVGVPFIIVLGAFLKIFGPFLGKVLASQLFLLFISTAIVVVTYLLGIKMSGKSFALLASIFVVFERYFLSFSIVPHNDVFAIAMGLVAFYFAILHSPIRYLLCPIFFYTAVFTRPEFYPVFGIPIIIFYLYKIVRADSRANMLRSIFIIVLLVLPFALVSTIMPAYTRFTIIEKFSLFLKTDLLAITAGSILTFYDELILNLVFSFVFVLSMVYCLKKLCTRPVVTKQSEGVTSYIRFRDREDFVNLLRSEEAIIAFCLSLIFAIQLVIVTVYGYSYVITDNVIEIIPKPPSIRYLILSRMLIGFPLAYLISSIAKEAYLRIASKDCTY